jgi:hypothetical protein
MPRNENTLYPEGYVEPVPGDPGTADERGRNLDVARSLIDLLVPVGGPEMRIKHIIDAICGTVPTTEEKGMVKSEKAAGTWLVNGSSIGIRLTETPNNARLIEVRYRVQNREASLREGIHELVVGPAACRSLDRNEVRQLIIEEIASREASWTFQPE